MRIPVPPTETVGLIYVIRSGERVKIGWARNVEKRRAELQTGSPDRLEVVARYRALLNYYASWPWDVLEKKIKRPDCVSTQRRVGTSRSR